MIISNIAELRTLLSAQKVQGKTIGFVPTMGYLHEGHLSLIRQAKAETDFVVVSVFVNPTQFAPHEDFDAYPRDIVRDTELSLRAGADLIFYPEVSEMYPEGASTFVEVEGDITHVLCGLSRPAHFKGVTTVVNILFNIVQPDNAYFGQKDAQQVAVLQKMVRDLHLSVHIIVCPIVREKSGLALSSRNKYLSAAQHRQATVLSEALYEVHQKCINGEKNAQILINFITKKINEKPLAAIDYVQILSYPMLQPIEKITEKSLVAVAVKFGNTRLIDNIILE